MVYCYNVNNLEQTQAVLKLLMRLSPVILQVSAGAKKYAEFIS